VHLFLNGRYLMDVPLYQKTGFNDREAAKEHGRRKRAYVASVKNADRAREKLWEAESPDFVAGNETTTPAAPASSRPKVAELVRLSVPTPPPGQSTDDERELSREEVIRILAETAAKKTG
jgi:hypothetical protein